MYVVASRAGTELSGCDFDLTGRCIFGICHYCFHVLFLPWLILHTSFPSLSFSSSPTRRSPSSGRRRITISSRTAYPRCLFRYSSPQASSSPSTSPAQSSVPPPPKNRLQTAVGTRESRESAQVRLASLISPAEGAGGAGGGREEFGKRVWRRVRSKVGNSCAG